MVSRGCTGRSTVDSHAGARVPDGGQLVCGLVTVAVLGRRPVASIAPAGKGSAAAVTRLTVTVAPMPRSPSAQVTVTPSGEEQPGLSADTNINPAGSVSRITTLTAGAAVLVTVS